MVHRESAGLLEHLSNLGMLVPRVTHLLPAVAVGQVNSLSLAAACLPQTVNEDGIHVLVPLKLRRWRYDHVINARDLPDVSKAYAIWTNFIEDGLPDCTSREAQVVAISLVTAKSASRKRRGYR
jgi:hypothetical protein